MTDEKGIIECMFSIKRFLLTIIFLVLPVLFLSVPSDAGAQGDERKTEVAVFVREGCTHCQDEEEYLQKLAEEQPAVSLKFYRLENPADRKLWEQLTSRLQISKVTPVTVIGSKYLIGFDSRVSTGMDIRKLITEAQHSKTPTDIGSVRLTEAGQQNSSCPDDGSIPCSVNPKASYIVTLPLMGKIDASKYPLFVLSALLGFFDGFNPCAMWVLVTFLIILLEVGDRKKMFIFAGTFILAEAIMYSLILTVWFKTWDFVRLDTIVTPAVGLVSIVGGLFFLKEWRKKELECKVTNLKHRADTTKKIQGLATGKFTVLTFLGILGVAFSVNIIEFACSIGIPQAFTKILELNHLPPLQWLFMIAIYIFFYMIDDFAVFGLAFWGADHLGITTKYSKFSNLVGGIVMLILGLILIFNSHLLLF